MKRATTLSLFILLNVIIVLIYNQSSKNPHGLNAEYFTGTDLQYSFRKKIDKNINFIWKYRSPFIGFSRNEFSIRWTGFLRVDREGPYEFIAYSDDGIRLWVGENLIIDDWTTSKLRKNLGRIFLKPGSHKIKLEYFEYKKKAGIQLRWKHASDLESSIIPPENFTTIPTYTTQDAEVG